MNRRRYLSNSVSLLLLPSLSAIAGQSLRQLLEKSYGEGVAIHQGHVRLQLPALAENGNSVRLAVAAPLVLDKTREAKTQSRLEFVQIFAPQNPQPLVAKFTFGELAATGDVQTRIRVAADQTIAAVAGYSNGSMWLGTAAIVVTEAACLDALY